MQQLLLTLTDPPQPSFDNFVCGKNWEVLATLQKWLEGNSRDTSLYLWGETGSGKSHLLAATHSAALAAGVVSAWLDEPALLQQQTLTVLPQLVLVDAVEQLSGQGQIALFDLYNRLKAEGGSLIASGEQPPAQLPLRPDLATRLGWGLVYRVQPLSEADKVSAMVAHAESRGFDLSLDIAHYLMRNWRRDLPALMQAVDALDRYSLQLRRPITLPLLKQALQNLPDGLQGPIPGSSGV